MLRDMKTHTHLKPGEKGTRRLVAKYGEALLCVRYRYDKSRGVMLKTVEIIEEQKPWPPSHRYSDEDIVAVTVAYRERTLRDRLKTIGGVWDPLEKVWRVPYRCIRGSELEERVVELS